LYALHPVALQQSKQKNIWKEIQKNRVFPVAKKAKMTYSYTKRIIFEQIKVF
jgi:hypothetical protein